jgi:multicomponent Na+:H+ antiporter subunit B
MKQQVLLRLIAKMVIPFILVFGFYVITHGEGGPGGGFQGGVILAAGFILYGLVFGAEELKKRIPPRFTDAAMAGGALLYATTGLLNLFSGGDFLDYGALRNIFGGTRGDMEVWGMTAVEYGVGITVCSVMITIYTQITERPAKRRSTMSASKKEATD